MRIETEATTEAGITTEVILGNAFDELDEPMVNVFLLPEHLEQRPSTGRSAPEDKPRMVESRRRRRSSRRRRTPGS
jgi:magnesium-transporting ATPase (P-type)